MQIRKEQETNSFQNLMSSCTCAISCYCGSKSAGTVSTSAYWNEITTVSSVEGYFPY